MNGEVKGDTAMSTTRRDKDQLLADLIAAHDTAWREVYVREVTRDLDRARAILVEDVHASLNCGDAAEYFFDLSYGAKKIAGVIIELQQIPLTR